MIVLEAATHVFRVNTNKGFEKLALRNFRWIMITLCAELIARLRRAHGA
jgi:hypothetical protein